MIELTPIKQGVIRRLAERYSLRLLLLFGSRVTGKIHRESDYDIGYLSARTLDVETEGRFINDLLPVVETLDERLVNLVNINKTGVLLRRGITDRCQVLYEDETALFARLQASAFKQYVEMGSTYQERARRLHRALLSK